MKLTYCTSLIWHKLNKVKSSGIRWWLFPLKLSKRLFPIQLIEGELKDEIIKYNDQEIGKVLIKNKFPFASIKYLNENFNEKNEFNCGNAKIKIIKPGWIK